MTWQVGGVHVCFAEGIKQCTKQVLNKHILQTEAKGRKAQREQELDAAKYKDVCGALSDECVTLT
jgi:hypothetical protein